MRLSYEELEAAIGARDKEIADLRAEVQGLREDEANHSSAYNGMKLMRDELFTKLQGYLAVVEAVTAFRDAWREDFSHIPPLAETRDFSPHLIRIWNALYDYEYSTLDKAQKEGGA